MQNNHPLSEDLLIKIEQEAEKIYDDLNETVRDYDYGLPYWPKKEIQPIVEGIASYARKLDIAMKALEDIAMSKVLPQTIASQALTRIKQLNNGE